MGSNLYFKREIKCSYLSDDLKNILIKKFALPYTVDESNIEYFSGLVDAGIKDASKIIDAIKKYEEITLGLEY